MSLLESYNQALQKFKDYGKRLPCYDPIYVNLKTQIIDRFSHFLFSTESDADTRTSALNQLLQDNAISDELKIAVLNQLNHNIHAGYDPFPYLGTAGRAKVAVKLQWIYDLLANETLLYTIIANNGSAEIIDAYIFLLYSMQEKGYALKIAELIARKTADSNDFLTAIHNNPNLKATFKEHISTLAYQQLTTATNIKESPVLGSNPIETGISSRAPVVNFASTQQLSTAVPFTNPFNQKL